jgi:hypothetical protein
VPSEIKKALKGRRKLETKIGNGLKSFEWLIIQNVLDKAKMKSLKTEKRHCFQKGEVID